MNSRYLPLLFLLLASLFVLFAHSYQVTYECTGGTQIFKAPQGAVSMTVVACGAAGFGPFGYAGKGFCVTDTISIKAGKVFNVVVGCAGGFKTGGFNGGGDSSGIGGGGGGASDIRTEYSSLNSRLIVGGGGGGYGSTDGNAISRAGGSGGCINGATASGVVTSAVGGTQRMGGRGGFFSESYPRGESGSLGEGGNGAEFTNSGGGGGGYYGGGGGAFGGGAGGSSFGSQSKSCVLNTLKQHGYIVIEYYIQHTVVIPFSGMTATFKNPGPSPLQIQVWGAQGQTTAMGNGGRGAYVNITIDGLEYDELQISVGSQSGYPNGGSRTRSTSTSTYSYLAASGGGSTTVRIDSQLFAIAAGGGGAGYDPFCKTCEINSNYSINGGEGGVSVGGDGDASPNQAGSYGGKGGSSGTGLATNYGVGGYYNASMLTGFSGGPNGGGNAAFYTSGGGGGGGYMPGGGGAFTGGGGGTSYVTTSAYISARSSQGGVREGNGMVVLTFVSATYNSHSASGSGGDDSDELSGGAVALIVIFTVIGALLLAAFINHVK